MTFMERIQRRFALSPEGARGLVKASIAHAVFNVVLMFPVALLYFLVVDLMGGGIPENHVILYIVGTIFSVVLIFVVEGITYSASYDETYRESGIRRVRIAESLRKLPLSFFGKKDLSDLTSTIMADSAYLETTFSHYVPELFGAICSTIFIAIGLAFFDWRLTLAAFWVVPVSLAIVFFSRKVQIAVSRRQTAVKMDLADGIQEYLETMRDLKANNSEQKYLSGLDLKVRLEEKVAIVCELTLALFVVSANLLMRLGIGTVAVVGSILLVDGAVNAAVFFMFLLVVSRVYDPLSTGLQNLAAIIGSHVKVDRMNEIFDYPVQTGSTEFHPANCDIVFEHVGFSYNRGNTVLADVSFTAKQGEVTALIGPSGGGKTTVSRLAARFWDVSKGKVTVGGVDVSTVDPETLLSYYSIVFQDVLLFNNSVMENIRVGRKEASDDEVKEAARLANCVEFVSKLPNGWDTMIGENGSELSGGERQRISIARAFLKNAPIILLDEATASLDVENETQVQEALSRLIAGKTVMLIAHRMRTVAKADKIVVLEDGIVSEEGSPIQLYLKNGTYRRMAELQGYGDPSL